MKMTCDGVKLSDKLGDDTNQLKKDVVSELQRGFSTEMQYTDIARNISALGNSSMSRAMRIARTEGGRIQSKADLDCAYRAKELGCDTVKQWNATLDGNTRSSHQKLHKEWRELDEPFSNGLMYPGDPNGRAAEVCNCRCSLDDLPRWYVEAGGAKYHRDNETGEIIECSNYAEFKDKYLNEVGRLDKVRWDKVATNTDKQQFIGYKNILGKNAPQTLDEFCKIKYNGGSEWSELKTLARSKNYLQNQLAYVLDTGEKNFIPTCTKFNSSPKIIAGKGSDKEIRVVDKLVKKFGGSKDDWQKKVVNIKSDKYIFDVHWYEYDGIQYEMKLKYRKERK